MNINWKLKSAVFSFIDVIHGQGLLYFLQKHITKRSKLNLTEVEANWSIHENNLSCLDQPKVLEFGAGKHLAQNLYLSRTLGSQTLVDLFPMIDLALVDTAAQQLSGFVSNFEYQKTVSLDALKTNYNVTYQAPVDLRETDFSSGEFDACVSTATLEHIPKDDIVAIFKELKRVIKTDGLLSMTIDYSDHYAHTDRSIGRLNFLQFSSGEFGRYNHNCHYLNRMRHHDYTSIFEGLGFEILTQEAINPADLPSRVSDEFDASNPLTLATRGIFLLKNVNV